MLFVAFQTCMFRILEKEIALPWPKNVAERARTATLLLDYSCFFSPLKKRPSDACGG